MFSAAVRNMSMRIAVVYTFPRPIWRRPDGVGIGIRMDVKL